MSRTAKRSHTSFNSIQPCALVAPDVPSGYATVASWWVTRELKAFELLCDPVGVLRQEEIEVRRRCQRRGQTPLWVSPSPLYKALGRDGETAFTIELLAMHYPENP